MPIKRGTCSTMHVFHTDDIWQFRSGIHQGHKYQCRDYCDATPDYRLHKTVEGFFMIVNVHFSMLVLRHVVYLRQKFIGQLSRALHHVSRIVTACNALFSGMFNMPFAIAMHRPLFERALILRHGEDD